MSVNAHAVYAKVSIVPERYYLLLLLLELFTHLSSDILLTFL